MKRCPQCLFIYPETDTCCDFDNTTLVVVDDAELEAATQAAAPKKRTLKKHTSKKRSRKSTAPKAATILLPLIGLFFGVVAILVYYTLSSRNHTTVENVPVTSVTAEQAAVAQTVIVDSSAPAIETASPSPSPSVTPKQTPERIATSHSRTTAAPISTSGPGIGKKAGGKSVILLTSGARIDADEVWRTRDGVWYRRNGIVTLLKHNRVKAISNH